MRRFWTTGLLSVSLILPTTAVAKVKPDREVTRAMNEVLDIYAECIMENAQTLEPSGEAAPVVADAAVAACRTVRVKAQEVIMLHAMVNSGVSVEIAGNVADQMLAKIDNAGREKAALSITKIRAEAKAGAKLPN